MREITLILDDRKTDLILNCLRQSREAITTYAQYLKNPGEDVLPEVEVAIKNCSKDAAEIASLAVEIYSERDKIDKLNKT